MPRGTTKFFNGAKGFGFIAPDDGGTDIFVHISAVERSGLAGLNEGDQVTFEVERDRKSGKIAAVGLAVVGFAAPAASRGPRPAPSGARGGYDRQDGGERRPAGPPRETLGAGSGVVKWFNSTKGFGFIQPSDGGTDVFVHISAVERAGLDGLADGQTIFYDLEQDRRTGKASATNLRLGD